LFVFFRSANFSANGETGRIERINARKSAAYDGLDVALEATAREHERVAPRPTVGLADADDDHDRDV
jgi:hypothetical protein